MDDENNEPVWITHHDVIDFFPAKPAPAEPCSCTTALVRRADAASRETAALIAEVRAARIARAVRDAAHSSERAAREDARIAREAERIERDRQDAEAREFRAIQAELDRKADKARADRDFAEGMAAADQAARDKSDADESVANFRIAFAALGRRDNRRAEDVARERADRDQQKRWRGGR